MSRDKKGAPGAAGAATVGPRPTTASASHERPAPPSAGEPAAPGLLPTLSLPKGGGAIRGIGETFSTDPATGTAALSVPIATSPGRAGYALGLALRYDSGAGNGPFGLGWQLSVPSVTRKTDKGLPRYADAEGSDTFVLSGAEDLVPARVPDGGATRPDVFDRGGHRVQRFRPRAEGLFARVERWTERATGDAHWRTVTRDNVLNVYGRSAAARVADPEDPSRVFSWLLEETHDDRGNVVRYTFKAEDGAGVDPGRASEAHRFEARAGGDRAFLAGAQRYLKRIQYGNRAPVADRNAPAPSGDADYLFEVIFDFGEHDLARPTPAENVPWSLRADPFSSYRAAFEARTYRLCRRVLMFHRFGELGPGPCLVRSTDFAYDESRVRSADGAYESGPVATYLTSVVQAGYRRDPATGDYERAAMPAVELGYVRPTLHGELRALEHESPAALAGGVDGAGAQWVDLDGEGLPGVLRSAEWAWFYQSNLGAGRLAPPALARTLPAPAQLAGGTQQLADLGGDGNLDLVRYSSPLAGYFERTPEGEWAPFAALPAVPNVDWQDPNLRFVDVDGDGFPDVLITEHDAFVWYRSRAKEGFDPAAYATKPRDERRGPALVFADDAEAIQLADMSGDGLADIVRVRNGEVCYWPNLGYGRFGRKVTLDGSPRFDAPDAFDPRRVHFADVDGSGASDVIYSGADGVRLYVNESGNALSAPKLVESLPPVDALSGLSVVDLLGTGTACLVRSSPLPGDATRPVIYVDLMGGKKPHLLDSVKNNLGAETRLRYAPSTTFYLTDKAAGRPWLTKLPFPVQVLERVDRYDHVSKSALVTRYAYHHGYFDAFEREFGGFACVEQWDAEAFGGEPDGGDLPGALGGPDGGALRLPPVRTVTWFHTGAWLERGRLETELAREYYDRDPQAPLLPDTALPPGLTAAEERAAARALRGRLLRQELYAEDGTPQAAHPYSASERDYTVRLLQRAEGAAPAAFFVHPRDAVTLHYERAPNDPRVQHESVLEVDDFGNVTKSAAVGYPRRGATEPEQARLWALVTEHAFANRPDEAEWYRVGVPLETTTGELTGLSAPPAGGVLSADQLRAIDASAAEIPYETKATGGVQKRVIERGRQLYYRDYATAGEYWADADGPLPAGQVTARAVRHHALRMALTPGLVAQVYGAGVGDEALRNEGGYVRQEGAWWAPSGRAVPDPGAFFLPAGAVDAFGGRQSVRHDGYNLLLLDAEDAVGNRVTAGLRDPAGAVAENGNDYRVLAPATLCDANRNRTRLEFDALGMVVALWQMGRDGADEGDDAAHPGAAFRYDLHAWREGRGPAFAHAATREAHRAGGDPFAADGAPRRQGFQHARTYSDGTGREVMKKVQAEPGEVPVVGPDGRLERHPDGAPKTRHELDRWVGTGRTVFDNKGNAVKQYEPFASGSVGYDDERAIVEWGVTPLRRYDPLGRLVRIDQPNGTYSAVAFDAWRRETWDESDAVLTSAWYARWRQAPADVAQLLPFIRSFAVGWAASPTDFERAGELCRALGAPAPTAAEVAWLANPTGNAPAVWQRALERLRAVGRAANLAAPHAGTPNVAHLDPLGRPFLEVADNGRDAAGAERERRTRLELDAEGNQLSVTDARGIRTLAQAFDALGRVVRVVSADAGESRTLPDAAGNPIRAWGARGHAVRRRYDPLRRPTHVFVREAGGAERLAERIVYGESHPDAEPRNLRTRAYQLFDGAGALTNARFDVKGNLCDQTRRLAREYRAEPDWSPLAEVTSTPAIEAAADALVEAEWFATASGFDALSRPRWRSTPDGSRTEFTYNEAGLLEAIAVSVRGLEPATTFVEGVEYNARGQRTLARYGNATTTRYDYDPTTFRLARQVTTTAGGAALQDLVLTHDPVGNVVAVADGVAYGNPGTSADALYEYDALYQLVRAEGREHPGQQPSHDDAARIGLPPGAHPNDWQALRRYREVYDYDAVGNIIEMAHQPGPAGAAGWTRRYKYATDSNRLRSTSAPGDAAGAFSAEYDHDASGNMTRMPHLPALGWDYADRLRHAKKQVQGGEGPANDVYCTYDSAGQRVRKVYEHGGLVEERVYLGGYEVYRKRRAGAGPLELERQTLHVTDGQSRVALVETKTVDASGPDGVGPSRLRYQLENHLGSSALELDEAGGVISYEEYFPFGGTALRAGNAALDVGAKRYRYTGKERDEETGLYYYEARYYASWLARWLSPDPAGVLDGLGRYTYVRNSPLRFNDSTGMVADDITAVGTASGPTFRGQAGLQNAQRNITNAFESGILPRGGVGAPQTAENLLHSINVSSAKSGFVQSSHSADVAVGFATDGGKRGGVVFEIAPSSKAIDVDRSSVAAQNLYPEQRVVAHPGGIAGDQIVRAYVVSKGGKDITQVVENPRFAGASSAAGANGANAQAGAGKGVGGAAAGSVGFASGTLRVAGGVVSTVSRAVVPGVAEAEIGFGVASLYAYGAGHAAIGNAMAMVAAQVPAAGASLVAGALVGNVAEAGAKHFGASDGVAKGAGALSAAGTGAVVGGIAGSAAPIIGTAAGAVVGGAVGFAGYFLSQYL